MDLIKNCDLVVTKDNEARVHTMQ